MEGCHLVIQSFVAGGARPGEPIVLVNGSPLHVACMHSRQVSVDLVFFVISSLLAGLAACA